VLERIVSISPSLAFYGMLVKTENNRSYLAVCFTSFLLRVQWGIATSFLPIQISELGGSAVEVGLVFSVFAAIMVPSAFLWGRISDYVGKRKPFIVSAMFGLPVIFILMTFQRDALPLLLVRACSAICIAAFIPCAWALVSDLSPPETVGRNMGILGSFETAGFAVGPLLGGVIVQALGFNVLWIIVAVICFAGGLIFLVTGADSTKLVKRASLVETARTRAEKGKRASKILVLYAATAVCVVGGSFLGPNFNVYVVRTLGYSKELFGVISLIGMGAAALLQPISGSLCDKLGSKPILITAGISIALGNLVLLIGGELQWIILSLILMSLYSSYFMAASAYVNAAVSPKEKSGALGILNSMDSFGRATASLAGGFVILLADVPTAIRIGSAFPIIAVFIILFAVKESQLSRQ
jgi:MFS family permease